MLVFHFILYTFTVPCEYDHIKLIEIVLIHGFKMIEEEYLPYPISLPYLSIAGSSLSFHALAMIGFVDNRKSSTKLDPGKV